MRHIEVIVDKWPIGSRNEVLTKGERAFVEDLAARILVAAGKAEYVEDGQTQKRRYKRRDMRAQD